MKPNKIAGNKRAALTLAIYGPAFNKWKRTNPTPEQVRAKNIKVVVAEPEWQRLRHDFVGTWMDPIKRLDNVKRLEAFVGNGKDPIKVRQVLNYLTGSAFRIGIINDSAIERLRQKVRKYWRDLLATI